MSLIANALSDIVLTYFLGVYERNVLFRFRVANYHRRLIDRGSYVQVDRDATVSQLLEAVTKIKPECDPLELEIFKFSEEEPLKDLSGYLTPKSDISDEEGEDKAEGEGVGGEGAGGEGAREAGGGSMDVDVDVDAELWSRPWLNLPLYTGDTILMAFPNVDRAEKYFVVRDSACAVVHFIQPLTDIFPFSSFVRTWRK